MEKGGSPAEMKFEVGQYKNYSENNSDLNSGWSSFANKQIPDGEVLIRPPRDENYRMIGFEYYSNGGNPMYAGIFKPGTYSPEALFKNNWTDFLAGWKDKEAKGNRMIDFDFYISGGKPTYTGIFASGTYRPTAIFSNSWEEFIERWQGLE